jgi:hypothetical protein
LLGGLGGRQDCGFDGGGVGYAIANGGETAGECCWLGLAGSGVGDYGVGVAAGWWAVGVAGGAAAVGWVVVAAARRGALLGGR